MEGVKGVEGVGVGGGGWRGGEWRGRRGVGVAGPAGPFNHFPGPGFFYEIRGYFNL